VVGAAGLRRERLEVAASSASANHYNAGRSGSLGGKGGFLRECFASAARMPECDHQIVRDVAVATAYRRKED